MLYSTTCEYAISALTYLAVLSKQKVLVREIAEAEDLPHPFLSKIFRTLVRAGILSSTKGRHGGYALTMRPEEISMYDIRAAIDGIEDIELCSAGKGTCFSNKLCPPNKEMQVLCRQIKAYLKGTTLADLAEAAKAKECPPDLVAFSKEA